MGRTKEQDDAVKCTGNYLVSAGAGSGKTAVLTDRIVYNILEAPNKVKLDEILILTFTNNAAGEMRDRLKIELAKKDETINLVPLVDSANICTFDSYFLYLIKKYCYKLGIDSSVEVVASDIVDIKKVEVLKGILNEKARIHDKDYELLIYNYCKKDYKTLIDVIMKADKILEDYYDLDEYKDNILKTQLDEKKFREFCNDNFLPEFKLHIQKAKEIIDDLNEDVVTNKFYAKNGALYNENLTFEDLSNFFSGGYTKVSFKTGYYKDAVSEAGEEIKKVYNYFKGLKFEERMATDFVYNQKLFPIFIDLIKQMREKTFEFKKEKNAFTFKDISFMAFNLLKDNEDVRLSIKNKLKLIMIDEYQDTSTFQEDFIKMIENNNVFVVGDVKQSIYGFRGANTDQFIAKYDNYTNHNGGEVINMNTNFRSRDEVTSAVNEIFSKIMTKDHGGADYKQSHMIDHGSKWYEENGQTENTHGVFALDYTVNEGSKSEVDNNAQIDALIQNIKVRINSKMQVYQRRKVHTKIVNGKEVEITTTRDCNYGDFAILIKDSTHFKEIEKKFNEAGIPINAVYKEDIRQDISVIVLINILKLIQQFNLKLEEQNENLIKHCFVSVVRSFLFSKTDDEIYQMISKNTYKDSPEFKKIYEFAKTHKNKLIHELYLDVLNEFEFIDKLSLLGNVIDKLKYNKLFFDRTVSMDKFGYDLDDFIEYLSSLDDLNITMETKTNSDVQNAVTLTTIHKSKGLQYKIVYLPFTDKGKPTSDDVNKYFIDREYGIFTPSLIDAEGHNFHSRFRDLYIPSTKPSELVRLFYVAVTRAEEEVCILRRNIIPAEDDSKIDFDPNEMTVDEYVASLDTEEKKVSKDEEEAKFKKIYLIGQVINLYGYENLKQNYYQNMTVSEEDEELKITTNNSIKIKKFDYKFEPLTAKKRASKVKSDVDSAILNRGTHLHLLLEAVDFKTKDCSFITNKYEREKIEKVLQNHIFDGLENARFYKEYEYYDDKEDTTGIIDLLIEKDDECIIIDYKTRNIDDKDYDHQLNTYRKNVERLFKKKAKCYLLSINLNEVREVKNESN